jgi:uncharacterized protein
MHASVYMAWIWSAGAVGSYFPWLVGRFLLGYVAGVLHWFDADGAAHLVAFRRVLIGGAIAGALGTAYTVAAMLHAFAPIQDITAVRIAAGVLNELDYLGLAAVYLAAIVLLMQRARWRRVLVVLAPVGRMPLTVYLSQSLIVTTLLYGPGLGWLRWISPTGCIGLALAIFGVQLALCTWWLRYFRFGPLEWVWRALVYMKRPAMRI